MILPGGTSCRLLSFYFQHSIVGIQQQFLGIVIFHIVPNSVRFKHSYHSVVLGFSKLCANRLRIDLVVDT